MGSSCPMHKPPKVANLARLNDFPEHAVLIADVICLWNQIEDTLADFLSLFANPDPWQADLILATVQSGKTKVDMIRSAGKTVIKDHDRLVEFDALMDRVIQCSQS